VRREDEGYRFPDPPTLFTFAAFDFIFGVFVLLRSSVFAGVAAMAAGAVFAAVGLLKKRRIIP
jgi:hypothetical protein